MPIPFPSGLQALIASGWCRMHPFLEIELPDDGGTLYYSTLPVTVAGNTYTPLLQRSNGGKVSLGASVDRISFALDNADAVAGQLLVVQQLTKARAVFGTLYLNLRNPAEAYRVELDDGVVTASAGGDETVELLFISSTYTGGSILGDLPVLKTCAYTYRSPECGYSGDLETCDLTFDGANGCRRHFPAEETALRQFGGHALFLAAPDYSYDNPIIGDPDYFDAHDLPQRQPIEYPASL